MKNVPVLQTLERVTSKTTKKNTADNERIVIELTASGAVILYVDISASPKIKRLACLPLDATLTDAERKNAFFQFLSTLGLKIYPKVVLLWFEGMTFRQMSIPEMPKEDLIKAFAWDLKKKYYFNLEDNLLGYKAVMTVDGAEGPETLYDIFYCENKTIFPRLNFILGLGLEIVTLVPASVALTHYGAQEEPSADKDVLICELVEGSVRILAIRGDALMLSRNVSVGSTEGVWTDEILNRVVEEIRKTIDYYEGQKYSRTISKVLFTGDGCDTSRILDFMTPKISVPVVVPNLEKFLSGSLDESGKTLLQSKPGLFTTALGAVLITDDALNLVPEDIKVKNRMKKITRVLNLGLVAFALILAMMAGMGVLNAEWMKGRLAALNKEFADINARRDVFVKTLSESKVRRAARKGDIPVRGLLKDLSLRIPALATLREIEYNRQDGALRIAGDVNDAKREGEKTLNQLVGTLKESVFIGSATVSSQATDEASNVLRFEIACTIKGLS